MANKKHKKQSRALLPAPFKCAVCGKVAHDVCPGCGRPVHRGCDSKHDCRGWQEGVGTHDRE